MTISRTLLSASVLLALACGRTDGAEDSLTLPSANLAEAAESVGCPAAPPENGARCSPTGLECSWGTDPRFGCRTGAVCERSSKWDVWQYDCPEPPPTCPRVAPHDSVGHDAKCETSQLGLTCVYSNAAADGSVAYTCANCDGNLCTAWNVWLSTDLSASCPTAVPNWGAACKDSALQCNYNVCANELSSTGVPTPWVAGTEVVCKDDVWTPGGNAVCP